MRSAATGVSSTGQRADTRDEVCDELPGLRRSMRGSRRPEFRTQLLRLDRQIVLRSVRPSDLASACVTGPVRGLMRTGSSAMSLLACGRRGDLIGESPATRERGCGPSSRATSISGRRDAVRRGPTHGDRADDGRAQFGSRSRDEEPAARGRRRPRAIVGQAFAGWARHRSRPLTNVGKPRVIGLAGAIDRHGLPTSTSRRRGTALLPEPRSTAVRPASSTRARALGGVERNAVARLLLEPGEAEHRVVRAAHRCAAGSARGQR